MNLLFMLMRREIQQEIDYLKDFVTDEKNKLFERLVRERTDYITVVLEDLYQPHNISAILRSCDCFGVQHIHIIENKNKFRDNTEISLGAREWLTLHHHPDQEDSTKTIQALKAQGYRIIATTPHEKEVMIDAIDLHRGKMAFFFGTELTGLSETTLSLADEYVKVPIYGFTESYNVSVCAGLLMYSVVQRLRRSDVNWRLSEEEKQNVLFAWYKHTIKASAQILKRAFRE
jgi:tRNA (guanosine-2'-O-)-methyltransferase